MHVLRRECTTAFALGSSFSFLLSIRCLHFVQPNRRFQHQQHVESVIPYLLHNTRNLLRVRNAVVDGFSKTLNELP